MKGWNFKMTSEVLLCLMFDACVQFWVGIATLRTSYWHQWKSCPGHLAGNGTTSMTSQWPMDLTWCLQQAIHMETHNSLATSSRLQMAQTCCWQLQAEPEWNSKHFPQPSWPQDLGQKVNYISVPCKFLNLNFVALTLVFTLTMRQNIYIVPSTKAIILERNHLICLKHVFDFLKHHFSRNYLFQLMLVPLPRIPDIRVSCFPQETPRKWFGSQTLTAAKEYTKYHAPPSPNVPLP